MKTTIKKLVLLFLVVSSFTITAQDFSYDKQLGAAGAVEVEQMIGIYPDSALNAYVNSVGQRLATELGNIPLDFQFQVVDMVEPNAFALPGGYIYVSRGILSLMNEEAELAGVLGHEMIHVTKRHSVKQMKKGIIPNLLQIPGAIVGGLINQDLGNIINAPIALGSNLFLSNYSRKQEKEADLLGIQLVAAAGYDPAKLAVILGSISAEMEHNSGEKEQKSYFSTHPYTPKRLDDIEKLIPEINYSPEAALASGGKVFFSMLEGMTLGQNPAQGIFRKSEFLHPDLNLKIVFPKKWETFNFPVAAGAIEPEGKAQLMMTVDTSSASPESTGKEFARMLTEKHQIKTTHSDSINLNGYSAWRVSFTEEMKDGQIKYHMYWVQTEKVKFQFLAAGYAPFSETLRTAVESIQPLSVEERHSIQLSLLSSAELLKEESAESFSQRVNNQWDLTTLMLMNGLNKETPLQEKTYLKIKTVTTY